MNKIIFDVVIIGAGFAGLTLAHHLPKNLKVLIIEKKPKLNVAYESTGLMTTKTKELLQTYVPELNKFIPNKIDTIGVIGPDFKQNFFSSTDDPWIYSTDTPALVAHIGEHLPKNVELKTKTRFENFEHIEDNLIKINIKENGETKSKEIKTKFLVGADGGRSQVAKKSKKLSQNSKFLFGYEKLYYGDITLGKNPNSSVYHYWFGDFSLGYGGWLSPTTVNGKKAFRIGLAKLEKDVSQINKLDSFIKKVETLGMIKKNNTKEIHAYGNYIPINGPLKKIYNNRTLVIGDAAGFCGAFAADGIKGALVSAKVAAKLIPRFLKNKNHKTFSKFKKLCNKHENLIIYFHKQRLYRFAWNKMKKNSTFQALFNLIKKDKETFISNFSDAKNKGSGLLSMIFKPKIIPSLIKYSLLWLRDFLTITKK